MVRLVIRSAVPGRADVHLDVPPMATIGRVKDLVSEALDDHPPTPALKLIYSGRVLLNPLSVEQVLRDSHRDPADTAAVTFHLVVSPSGRPAAYVPPPLPGNARAQPNHFAGQGAAPAGAPQAMPARRRGGGMMQLIKIGLMIMLLSQGGSTARVVVLFIVGFVLYLYQSGRLRFGLPAARPDAPVVGPDGVPVPTGPVVQHGVYPEIRDFVVPLFLSLIPTWMPDTYAYRHPHPRQSDDEQEGPDEAVRAPDGEPQGGGEAAHVHNE